MSDSSVTSCAERDFVQLGFYRDKDSKAVIGAVYSESHDPNDSAPNGMEWTKIASKGDYQAIDLREYSMDDVLSVECMTTRDELWQCLDAETKTAISMHNQLSTQAEKTQDVDEDLEDKLENHKFYLLALDYLRAELYDDEEKVFDDWLENDPVSGYARKVVPPDDLPGLAYMDQARMLVESVKSGQSVSAIWDALTERRLDEATGRLSDMTPDLLTAFDDIRNSSRKVIKADHSLKARQTAVVVDAVTPQELSSKCSELLEQHSYKDRKRQWTVGIKCKGTASGLAVSRRLSDGTEPAYKYSNYMNDPRYSTDGWTDVNPKHINVEMLSKAATEAYDRMLKAGKSIKRRLKHEFSRPASELLASWDSIGPVCQMVGEWYDTETSFSEISSFVEYQMNRLENEQIERKKAGDQLKHLSGSARSTAEEWLEWDRMRKETEKTRAYITARHNQLEHLFTFGKEPSDESEDEVSDESEDEDSEEVTNEKFQKRAQAWTKKEEELAMAATSAGESMKTHRDSLKELTTTLRGSLKLPSKSETPDNFAKLLELLLKGEPSSLETADTEIDKKAVTRFTQPGKSRGGRQTRGRGGRKK